MAEEVQIGVETPRQSRSRWGLIWLCVGVVALYLVTSRPAPALEGWGSDFEEALQRAAAKQKYVLVAFYMHGCAYCDAMDRTVLNQRAVQSAVEAFVPVRVDVEQRRELANRYGVVGAPMYAVVAPTGDLIAITGGYQPEAEFISFLHRAWPPSRRPAAKTAAQPPGNR